MKVTSAHDEYTVWSTVDMPEMNEFGSVMDELASMTNVNSVGLNDSLGSVTSTTMSSSSPMNRHSSAVMRRQMFTVSPSDPCTSPSVVNTIVRGVGTGKYAASEITLYAPTPPETRDASTVMDGGADGFVRTSYKVVTTIVRHASSPTEMAMTSSLKG